MMFVNIKWKVTTYMHAFNFHFVKVFNTLLIIIIKRKSGTLHRGSFHVGVVFVFCIMFLLSSGYSSSDSNGLSIKDISKDWIHIMGKLAPLVLFRCNGFG